VTASSAPSAGSLSATELLYDDFAAEHTATRRFLERYPDGKGAWRPHERSRALDQLATHVADIVYRGVAILESDGMDVGSRPPLTMMDSARELVAHFDAGVARFNAAVAGVDFEHLAKPWALRRDGHVLIQQPRRILLRRMMMSHLVHHRAQLGVYYRLLGVPVPGAYGPSADD